MRRFTTSLLLAASLVLPAVARADTGTVAQEDKDFMNEAAQGGMAEVKLGELAKTKAENAAVKSFGERMVTDHTKVNDELKTIATKKNVTLPTDLSSDDQKLYDDLSKKSGADFDKAYMDAMVTDHDKDIAAFEKCEKSSKDKDLKAFIHKTLPTLKTHGKMAHADNAKLKKM